MAFALESSRRAAVTAQRGARVDRRSDRLAGAASDRQGERIAAPRCAVTVLSSPCQRTGCRTIVWVDGDGLLALRRVGFRTMDEDLTKEPLQGREGQTLTITPAVPTPSLPRAGDRVARRGTTEARSERIAQVRRTSGAPSAFVAPVPRSTPARSLTIVGGLQNCEPMALPVVRGMQGGAGRTGAPVGPHCSGVRAGAPEI